MLGLTGLIRTWFGDSTSWQQHARERERRKETDTRREREREIDRTAGYTRLSNLINGLGGDYIGIRYFLFFFSIYYRFFSLYFLSRPVTCCAQLVHYYGDSPYILPPPIIIHMRALENCTMTIRVKRHKDESHKHATILC